MGSNELRYLIPIVKSLRDRGVACEIYPEQTKLKKQFDYADKKSIPFISIVGETEVAEGRINLKNLADGRQESFAVSDIDAMLAFLS